MRTKNAIMNTTLIAVLAAGAPALADSFTPTNVPNPQAKVVGNSAPNVVSPELALETLAQGSTRLEPNSDSLTKFYGYDNDGPMLPAPGDVQSTSHNVEATKTEPDKNTYLVVCPDDQDHCARKLTGPDPAFDYGSHFLFQGHENGLVNDANKALRKGYITRINLDVDSEADGDHRVTLLATKDVNGNPLPAIDGSTWDPWAQRLLFTSENGGNGGVWQATLDYPAKVEDISCVLGRGGYEGIQNDSDGNLWIVEDSGGKNGEVLNTHAKRPNSFLYRFLPNDKTDLKKGGKLQALQVITSSGPLVFNAVDSADTAIKDPKVQELHTCGKLLQTKWIDLKTTNQCDPAAAFNANALAKTAGATPFKRPENGQFHPGSKFTEFFFDETGDTDLRSEAATPDPTFGGFGSILKVTQLDGPLAVNGTIQVFYLSAAAHSSFDNVGFWSKDQVVFVQDMGDTLHTQLQALDSAYLFNVKRNYCDTGLQPTRILAQGRDASATIDSGLGSVSGNGFQNDGDNEITGWHTSNGDPTPKGILGAKIPHPFHKGWRTFYTQQHGDNVTYEVVKRASWSDDDEE